MVWNETEKRYIEDYNELEGDQGETSIECTNCGYGYDYEIKENRRQEATKEASVIAIEAIALCTTLRDSIVTNAVRTKSSHREQPTHPSDKLSEYDVLLAIDLQSDDIWLSCLRGWTEVGHDIGELVANS